MILITSIPLILFFIILSDSKYFFYFIFVLWDTTDKAASIHAYSRSPSSHLRKWTEIKVIFVFKRNSAYSSLLFQKSTFLQPLKRNNFSLRLFPVMRPLTCRCVLRWQFPEIPQLSLLSARFYRWKQAHYSIESKLRCNMRCI